MSSKIAFIEQASRPRANIAALCREHGISRQTGHKWLKRYQAVGYEGLEDQSRRPKSAPLATGEDIVSALLVARAKHARWGPRKLVRLLERQFGELAPSERTVARIHVSNVIEEAERIAIETLIPIEAQFSGENGEAVLYAVTVWLASIISSEEASVESIIQVLRTAVNAKRPQVS